MKVIADGRKTGRTTKLIEMAAEQLKNGELAYIVCHSHHEANRIYNLAQEMGHNIPFPITYRDMPLHGASPKLKLYIDNADAFLSMLCGPYTLEAITVLAED